MFIRDKGGFWTKDRFTLPSPKRLHNRWNVWQKKRLNRKMYRKPNVKRYIAAWIIISLLVSAAVFTILYNIRWNRFNGNLSDELNSEIDRKIQSSYDEAYGEQKPIEKELREELNGGPLTDEQKEIQYNLMLKSIFNYKYNNLYSIYPSIYRKLYNDDMSEEIAGVDSDEIILSLFKEIEENHYDWHGELYYECRDKEISRQLKEIKNKYQGLSEHVYFEPSMKGAYIRDDYSFIPVDMKLEVTVSHVEKKPHGHYEYTTEYVDIKNSPLSSEELEKQGYRYVDVNTRYDDKNKNAWTYVIFTMDSDIEKLFDDTIKTELDYSSNDIVGTLWQKSIIKTNDSFKKYTVISVVSTSFLDSYAIDYEYIWESELNPTNRQVLKREFILAAVIIFVLVFMILYLRYIRRMKHYEMNTYRRELTNVLAHDIKTPLMAIRGNAENLQDLHRQEETSEDKLYVDGIVRNVDYVDSLVNKTLSLSSLESGFEMLNKENVSVKDILDSVLARDKELLDKRGIKIDISGEDITVSADEFWFGEALENLFSNAAKYADEASTVNVEIKKRSLRVINSISDMVSGDGSPDAKKLSNPFYKNDRSRSGRGGSGIGLSIVKNIIEMHGWRFKTKVRDGKFIAEIVM